MPTQFTLTQNPENPCNWNYTGVFLCSPSGTNYDYAFDLFVEEDQVWLRWWAGNTSNVWIWTLPNAPLNPLWQCDEPFDIPYDYNFGSFFCWVWEDAVAANVLVSPGEHPGGGSVGAMLDPDCQPQFRRGKPLIPKGKRKG